jgi:dynein intermediate chain
MTFESAEDYIYDVQWNGNNPTLFSTCDGEGYVDLWDISLDQEAPISRFKTGTNSLNKSTWSADGLRLAVGDSKGNV